MREEEPGNESFLINIKNIHNFSRLIDTLID